MMRRSLHMRMILLAWAAVWTCAATAPESLRICIQSSGLVQTGLSCPCADCQQSAELNLGQCAAFDCGCTGESTLAIRRQCCTCIELPVLVSLQSNRNSAPDQLPVAMNVPSQTGAPIRLRPALASAWNTPANPPPLLTRPMVLRL